MLLDYFSTYRRAHTVSLSTSSLTVGSIEEELGGPDEVGAGLEGLLGVFVLDAPSRSAASSWVRVVPAAGVSRVVE